MWHGSRLSLLIILLLVLILAGCRFFLTIFPWEEMVDVQTIITFADLSQEQTLLVGTYEWRVWVDVDGNVGTGKSTVPFQGSDVEILFTSAIIYEDDLGSYTDTGTLNNFVSRTHKDASLYTWAGAVQTLETLLDPVVLVDGNSFVFGSFAHWEPYADLDPNFVIQVEVTTPSGADQTDAPLVGNNSTTDSSGDAGSAFADIVAVRALFNVP